MRNLSFKTNFKKALDVIGQQITSEIQTSNFEGFEPDGVELRKTGDSFLSFLIFP